ncbi:MAG: hypothetical protein PHI86_01110 [Candidatus Omnitrophica bacterium]|nr:hypothetical protein [Candidatus Omnitrophota bacterium]HOX54584.1 hypothetical protein [Candidatus Omnitrophota bacterium]
MSILTLIRGYVFKLLNFILGKSKIFIVILGWFLVISGVLMLIWPERARRKLIGMGFGQVKWILLIIAFYLVSLLSSFSSNIGPNIFLIGLIAIIVAYFLLKKKTAVKIQEQFAKIPVKALKLFAIVQIVIGAFMLIFLVRIWF